MLGCVRRGLWSLRWSQGKNGNECCTGLMRSSFFHDEIMGYIYNQIEYNSPPLSNEWEITVQRLVNYSKHSCSDAANAGAHFSNANDTHYFCLLKLARRFPLWVEWGREKAMPWRFSTTEAVTTVPCSCSYLIPSELDSGCLSLSAFCSPHWIRDSKLFHS